MAKPISDEAVRAKTGKVWREWFAVLDTEGAASMDHMTIARHLSQEHALSGWWSQMVTVAYERARGRRERHQTARGFEVSVSKTLPVPVEALYRAWTDEDQRRRWLGDDEPTIRKATANKSLRITWIDGDTNVGVHVYSKGAAKSTVTVQHTKLADRDEVEAKRAYWKTAVGRLAEQLT